MSHVMFVTEAFGSPGLCTTTVRQLCGIFTYTPLILEGEGEKIYPMPKYVHLMTVTTYNLKKLEEDIVEAASFHNLSDPQLDRALQYYELALLLFERREMIAPVLSRQHAHLISVVFLYFWKAISAVVGDPSKDSDYQKRYRSLGFDYDYFKTKIEMIRKLRNDYDVAHYSLDENRIKEVDSNFKQAAKVVVEVVQKYRESRT